MVPEVDPGDATARFRRSGARGGTFTSVTDIDKQTVLDRLGTIRGPDDDRDIVRRGMVSDVFVTGDKVMFSITVPAERAQAYEPMRAAAETAVRAIPGVAGAMVVLTAEKRAGAGSPTAARPPPPGASPGGRTAPPTSRRPTAQPG